MCFFKITTLFKHSSALICTLLKITHWRLQMCTSGASSNPVWLVLHCVITQKGGTAASGRWLQLSFYWPCDGLQPLLCTNDQINWSAWPVNPLDTGNVLISSIPLLGFPHAQSKRIHTGPTSSIAAVTPLPVLRWVWGGTYIDTAPELSFPVVSGKQPEAESLAKLPLTALKC